MSHNVHPYAHRIGIIRGWKSRWFGGKKNFKELLRADTLIREYLEKQLRGKFVADIEIERSRKATRIIVKSSRPGMVIGRSGEGAAKLKQNLLRYMKRKDIKVPEDFKIDIVDVQEPESNAMIVAHMIAEALEVPAARIFFKERKPQRGREQYEKFDEQGRSILVQENGLRFVVNLTDYLDTGLFLDHRPTREKVREQAEGKRVLNLFAYTGSFTVYAAAGGASATTTIDLSNTYLEWGQRNMELNGLAGPQHEFVRADVKAWLEQAVDGLYDIVVLDPPTFSNSKRMEDVLYTQRDHPELINGCLRRLAPGGQLYFSTNFRKFQLEPERLNTKNIRDITSATIPKDFRNPKIHYCWLITGG